MNMEDLRIEPTRSSPLIHFSADGSRWELTGKSCPENVRQCYDPVFEWVRHFMGTKKPVSLHVKLTYFNTSSSKTLLDFFELLAKYNGESAPVAVHWYHELYDEDMRESGEEFAEDVDLPFTFLTFG